MTHEQKDKARIDAMTREQLGRSIRFAAIGAWPWDKSDSGEYALKRFEELGGWTPELSKTIGW